MNDSLHEKFTLLIPQTEEELNAYYKLRFEILRKPWGQPEDSVRDEWEDNSVHVLLVLEDHTALATGRLQLNSEEEGQIRSMAVKDGYQGRGLGSAVLKFIEEIARERKLNRIILDAREKAIGFYEKHGYSPCGKSYTLFGVIPHVRMEKILTGKK
jgi:GNAT superfamily N-acetyltransferase